MEATGEVQTHTSPIRSESLRLGSVLLPPHGMEFSQIVAFHGLGRLQLLLPQCSLLLPLQFLLSFSLLLPLSLSLPLSLALSLPLQLLLALPLPFSLPLFLSLCLALPLFFALPFSFTLPFSLSQLILQLEPKTVDRRRQKQKEDGCYVSKLKQYLCAEIVMS